MLTFDRVVERQDVDTLAVLDVVARADVDQIAELDAQVVASNCYKYCSAPRMYDRI